MQSVLLDQRLLDQRLISAYFSIGTMQIMPLNSGCVSMMLQPVKFQCTLVICTHFHTVQSSIYSAKRFTRESGKTEICNVGGVHYDVSLTKDGQLPRTPPFKEDRSTSAGNPVVISAHLVFSYSIITSVCTTITVLLL